MTAPASITVINRPPERFDDRIHERIVSRDPEDGHEVDTTVIGGVGEPVSLQLAAPGMSASALLTPEAAIRVGQVLIAAGREARGISG